MARRRLDHNHLHVSVDRHLLGTPQEHKVPGLLFVIAMVLVLMLGLLTDRLPNPH